MILFIVIFPSFNVVFEMNRASMPSTGGNKNITPGKICLSLTTVVFTQIFNYFYSSVCFQTVRFKRKHY